MVEQRFHNKFLTISIMLMGSVVFAQEIPFDPNVTDNGGTSTWTQAPSELNPNNPPPQSPNAPDVPPINELNQYPTAPQAEVKPPVEKPAVKQVRKAELAGLGTLAPFSDVAVISKRFLPKTKRFEFFPNVGMILNNSFYTSTVYGGRLSFYFTENYGVEALYFGASTTSKEATNELLTIRAVETATFATPKYYYGLDFKWSPIYGKIGFMNKTIVPFDFYFNLGGGITATNQDTSPATLHLGGGQIFAITKWMAARWDVSWFAYKTDSKQTTTGGTTPAGGTYTDLHATIGVSFFFPGASYR